MPAGGSVPLRVREEAPNGGGAAEESHVISAGVWLRSVVIRETVRETFVMNAKQNCSLYSLTTETNTDIKVGTLL